MSARAAGRAVARALPVLLGCTLAAGCGAVMPAPAPPETGPPSIGAGPVAAGPLPAGPLPAGQALAGPLPAGPAPLPAEDLVKAASLRIPAIDVSEPVLEPLGLLADGSLAAPVEWGTAGAYSDGPVPGDRGPAVMAGHVDSVAGPAVFFRLRELRPGDLVEVGRTDGRTVTFRVDRSVSVPKDEFPTGLVYGPTPDAQLRIITCSGDFDRVQGSYVDNTVVMATATG